MPGPGVELIGAEETAEVLEVISSGFLSRYGPSDNPAFGAKVHRIEGEIAKLAGVRFGLGLSGGGSAGLWITLLSLGVGAGDEVIVPGFTFVASISAIVYTGATPVLAEVDQIVSTWTPPTSRHGSRRGRRRSSSSICSAVRQSWPSSRRSPTSTASRSSRIAPRRSEPPTTGVGVGGIGAAGVYSFNEYKTITCGDGGMIVTDDEALYERCVRDARPGPCARTGSSRSTRRGRSWA